MGGVTPTARGLVFFGDVGANFVRWMPKMVNVCGGQKIGRRIGGGVITYAVNDLQKVAVTTDFMSSAWRCGYDRKIAILGVEDAAANQ